MTGLIFVYSYDRRPDYSYDRRVAAAQLIWDESIEPPRYGTGYTWFTLTAIVPNLDRTEEEERFEIKGSTRSAGEGEDTPPPQTHADVETWTVAFYLGRSRRPQGYLNTAGKLLRLPTDIGSLDEAKKLAELYREKRAMRPTDPAVVVKLLTEPQKKLLQEARQNNDLIPDDDYRYSRAGRTFLTRMYKVLREHRLVYPYSRALTDLGKEVAALL